MPSTYLQPIGSCYTPCTTPAIVNVPGTKGDQGDTGADGEDGVNAYTILAANFVVPNIDANVQIEVLSTEFLVAGLPLFIETAGSYRIFNVDSDTLVTVTNLGLSVNASPTTEIIAGAKVVVQGEHGEGASGLNGVASGQFALPNGVQDFSVTGLNLGFTPSQVILTVLKPPGGLNLVATVEDGSITDDGFDISLNGMTNSTDYSVMFIAVP